MTTISRTASADAAFGVDLYQKLAVPPQPTSPDRASPANQPRPTSRPPVAGGNIVFSPASIAAALKMALAGARGETAAELASALHLDAPEDAAPALAELADIPSGGDLTLRAPNTMWLDSALSVRDEYLRQLVGSVSVRRCDFAGAPDAARQAINTAVADETAGKITDLIQRGLIGTATRLVLVNAIYLNALWTHPFPAENTKDKPFYPERMSPAAIPSMRLETRLAYHRGDGCQSVLLPYRDGTLAMALLLPDGPLSEFTQSADVRGALSGVLAEGTECQVDLSLPRFRIEAGFRLEDTLRSLGVRRAFESGADFGGISSEPLSISAVVHKAWIDVGEKGTEAAAATAVVMRSLAMVRKPKPDVRLVVDRPFLFAIADTRTGLPLFLGQLTRPRLPPAWLSPAVIRLRSPHAVIRLGSPHAVIRLRHPPAAISPGVSMDLMAWKALVIGGMVAFAGNRGGCGRAAAGVRLPWRAGLCAAGSPGGSSAAIDAARGQQRRHRRGPAAHVTHPPHAP